MEEASRVIQQLEYASAILMASPAEVSVSKRHEAEQVFLSFRKSWHPLQLLQCILDSCQVDHVLFECCEVMKQTLVRDFNRLEAAELTNLSQFLMHQVLNRDFKAYVREKLVQVIAIMVKRRSVADQGQELRKLLDDLKNVIVSGHLKQRLVAFSILAALLHEYANTVKSSDVGLPWNDHFKVKRRFESSDLRSIFEFCLQALRELAANIDGASNQASNEVGILMQKLLSLAESVLSWNFISLNLPKKLISLFESDHSPSFRPPPAWKELILNPELVRLFYQLVLKSRRQESMEHHSWNCLIQLASLNGSVVADRECRIGYFVNFIRELLQLISMLKDNLSGKEALYFSNIIRKLMLFFPPPLMLSTEQDVCRPLLEGVAKLTCLFIKASVNANLDDDQSLYTEAHENMLIAWVSVLHESESLPKQFCADSAAEIFNTFVQSHLSAPDGFRPAATGNEDIVEETEEKDRVLFKETLATVGALARETPQHSLMILSRLLESKLPVLQSQIEKAVNQQSTSDSGLDETYEDLHWITLVAGNVLTLDTDGEAALIPPELMRFSLCISSTVDVNASLQLIASLDQSVTSISNYEQADPVIRVFSNLLRLMETETRVVQAGYERLTSPELSCSLLWFFKRWSLTYLCMQEKFYSEISPVFTTAFGDGSQGAQWLINTMIKKVNFNLSSNLNAEPSLINDTIALLIALVDNKERGREVIKSEALEALLSLLTNSSDSGNSTKSDSLPVGSSVSLLKAPAEARRGLYQALTLLGSVFDDQNLRQAYWTRVLTPIGEAITTLTNQGNKAVIEEEARRALSFYIDALIGVVKGTLFNTARAVFSFLEPLLGRLAVLVGLLHNFSDLTELILELFAETARNPLCYLSQSETRLLYQRSIECIQMYAHHNKGRRSSDKEAEEEQYRDLLLLLEMLMNLLSKDLIDLSPPEPSIIGDGSTISGISAADVCLHGTDIVMPLMSLELLRFTKLSIQYFKTVTLICELYPDKMCSLSSSLQQNLIKSLEIGLTTLGVDAVYSLCCDFLQSLCSYMVRTSKMNCEIFQLMRPFTKLMLDLILSEKINSDLLPKAGETLYVLICAYQDTFNELVSMVAESESDAGRKKLVYDAFADLTSNISLTADRMSRIRFKENFERFIVTFRGLLLVK